MRSEHEVALAESCVLKSGHVVMTVKKSLVSKFVIAAGVVAAACNSGSIPAYDCSPGVTMACTGPGGCSGSQACDDYGTGYGACLCGSPAGMDASANEASVEASATDSNTVDVVVSDGASEATANDGSSDGAGDASGDSSSD
jgi:hypothetical protein